MSLTLANIAVAALMAMTVGLLALSFSMSRDKHDRIIDRRLSSLGLRNSSQSSSDQDEDVRSRAAITKALQELEALKRSQGRYSLRRLLKNAGEPRSLRAHLIMSILFAVVLFGLLVLPGVAMLPAAEVAIGAGFGLPILQLQLVVRKRRRLLTTDLPGALDLIVRGLRAGLPLIECFKLTATEWREPLKGEFVRVVNDLSVGLSIREAINRFAERVPLQEAKLFSIVVAIQAQSGGNLSEVLGNLADLLREREKLIAKIRSMTSEARTSAWIIGSIPVILIALISLVSPDFMKPLLETTTGNVILVFSGIWMATGVFVMTAMMRIDL
jgi:tight adherence protein B